MNTNELILQELRGIRKALTKNPTDVSTELIKSVTNVCHRMDDLIYAMNSMRNEMESVELTADDDASRLSVDMPTVFTVIVEDKGTTPDMVDNVLTEMTGDESIAVGEVPLKMKFVIRDNAEEAARILGEAGATVRELYPK